MLSMNTGAPNLVLGGLSPHKLQALRPVWSLLVCVCYMAQCACALGQACHQHLQLLS